MKGKKFWVLVLSAAMCLSLMTGCGGKEKDNAPVDGNVQDQPKTDGDETEDGDTQVSDDPLEKITKGYYQYCYNTEPDGSGMLMTNFFHFYEEKPVIGSVFYAGYALNQIFFVGTYNVEEIPYEYSCYPDRAAVLASEDGTETKVTGTAPYTITCFDWDGNEIGKMGFDGDVIYNDCAALSAVSTENNMFLFDLDGTETGYAEYYAGEVGQPYMNFAAEDPTSTLTLYHNGTYMDLVDVMVEGTWNMEESEEGFAYTLTPNDPSDTGASFVVSADKATAVYTPDGGEALDMSNASAGPAAAYSFAGEFEMAGMTADLTAYCYQDGTAAVIASMSGMEKTVDQGTWEMTGDYNMLFHLDGVGDIQSAANEDGVSVQYTNEATEIGPLDVTLSVVAE